MELIITSFIGATTLLLLGHLAVVVRNRQMR
jgi:hypothetical protein